MGRELWAAGRGYCCCRFDTNRDNMLSFDEFCRVADVAIDGDSKLATPTVSSVPAGGKKTTATVPAGVASSRLRSLQTTAAPSVCVVWTCGVA